LEEHGARVEKAAEIDKELACTESKVDEQLNKLKEERI
jgi:hypothetical protein